MPDYTMVSRRGFVKAGLAVATTLQLQRAAKGLGATTDTQVCQLSAEQEVGPYYVADELLRADIAEAKPGLPLLLRLILMDARTCKPLSNAAIDVWHCDALGLYSGFTKQSLMGPPGFDPQRSQDRPRAFPDGPPPDGPPPDGPPFGQSPDGVRREGGRPPQMHPSDKLTFLRGIQLTDASGVVNFQTVFPGFYMGRTNHIHFKVRLGGHTAARSYASGHTSHTGQIFFPEEFAATLMQHEPYRKHQIHRTTQAEDDIYSDQHGELSVARVTNVDANNPAAGLRAELIAAVDPSAEPAAVGRREGRGRPRFGGPPI